MQTMMGGLNAASKDFMAGMMDMINMLGGQQSLKETQETAPTRKRMLEAQVSGMESSTKIAQAEEGRRAKSFEVELPLLMEKTTQTLADLRALAPMDRDTQRLQQQYMQAILGAQNEIAKILKSPDVVKAGQATLQLQYINNLLDQANKVVLGRSDLATASRFEELGGPEGAADAALAQQGAAIAGSRAQQVGANLAGQQYGWQSQVMNQTAPGTGGLPYGQAIAQVGAAGDLAEGRYRRTAAGLNEQYAPGLMDQRMQQGALELQGLGIANQMSSTNLAQARFNLQAGMEDRAKQKELEAALGGVDEARLAQLKKQHSDLAAQLNEYANNLQTRLKNPTPQQLADIQNMRNEAAMHQQAVGLIDRKISGSTIRKLFPQIPDTAWNTALEDNPLMDPMTIGTALAAQIAAPEPVTAPVEEGGIDYVAETEAAYGANSPQAKNLKYYVAQAKRQPGRTTAGELIALKNYDPAGVKRIIAQEKEAAKTEAAKAQERKRAELYRKTRPPMEIAPPPGTSYFGY